MPSLRLRTAEKASFDQLTRELALVLRRPVTQGEAVALLLAYAEGDTAGFLGWAERQEVRSSPGQEP